MEFPNKNFFTGKLESLGYCVYRRDLFPNGWSEAQRSVQLKLAAHKSIIRQY